MPNLMEHTACAKSILVCKIPLLGGLPHRGVFVLLAGLDIRVFVTRRYVRRLQPGKELLIISHQHSNEQHAESELPGCVSTCISLAAVE